jgi:predicted AlkP superfamily phosphohydrolase/phosphomutase
MKAKRVLVVGLDGATLDLIRPWAEQGKLPTFSRIMREGASGELTSTILPVTAPAWTSFMTGKNPGKHGLFDWIYRNDDGYDFAPVNAKLCREGTIWSLASEAGKRVVVVNVPMTYPPKKVNGFMVTGMLTPSTQVEFTFPPDLAREIEREIGEYIIHPDPGEAYSEGALASFLTRLYKAVDLKVKLFEYLLQKDDWDFAMMVFMGTDVVQHACWRYMSPDHPLYEADKARKFGDTILKFYQRMDEVLARWIDTLDDQTILIIMSDHGFGPFHKFIHVNNWLIKLGLLKLKRTPLTRVRELFFRCGFSPMTIYNLLRQLGLGKLKGVAVKGRGRFLLRNLFLSFEDVHWARTKAYSIGNIGQININLKGREPHGTVAMGEEYQTVREEIMAALGELEDPETDEKIVEKMYRREEVYWGRYLERAPDIVFLPRRLEYFGFGEHEFGAHTIIEASHGISGTHRMNGVLMMMGNGIREGVELRGAEIIDLAPTILHLMGLPIPSDMDGQVLAAAMEGELAANIETREQAEGSPDPEPVQTVYSDEEERQVAERLRSLGYLA